MTSEFVALCATRIFSGDRPNIWEDAMSKQCEMCGKKPQTGHYVSHSNIKTNRVFNPNLQRVRHQFSNGEVRTVTVCTRCLRSGKITKPVVRKAE